MKTSVVILLSTLFHANAFQVPIPKSKALNKFSAIKNTKTVLQESKIPIEYRAEMYQAEARTPSAQGRQDRILSNSLLSCLFLVLTISNYTLSIHTDTNLDDWTKFIPFLGSKWGGYFDIVATIFYGTNVVFELWTKEIVAQSIWKEFEKRGKSYE